MYRVKNLIKEFGVKLGLTVEAGTNGLHRPILVPQANRPGISLTGYLKGYGNKRILVFGQIELKYLKDLDTKMRRRRLKSLLSPQTPAVIVARGHKPPEELVELCEEKAIPLLRTTMSTMNLLSQLTLLLAEEFAPTMDCHGTLVEVFGVGVLIRGDSSIGKSEAALGLIERGHRLISDDIVCIRKLESGNLEGRGVALTKHLMEVRGIGIINVAYLYGAVCIREKKSINLVVNLEVWNEDKFYDRVGLDEETENYLGVKIPSHILPVKPGRDVVLLLETVALNHRLKLMGYHSAKEFQIKLLDEMCKKNQMKGSIR
ncbi:HPr(Ser) kinase/phosphatase [Chlamydiales bacterium]|nr:HPr(Ser) kinase/phosphatase [Chlamydiales bacterium]